MAKNVQILETGKGYSLTTTTVPETNAELSAKTGISKEAIRSHLSSMGGQFDADGHVYFDAEVSAELALSIFDGVEVKEVEAIAPDDPVLSEHPEEDEPNDEAEIGTETAPVTEATAEPEPVAATVKAETVAETAPAKPEVTVKAIISPDFMSFTLTTEEERETIKEIAEKGGLKSNELMADVYLCNGKIGADDFISFDSEEDANKAAVRFNRRIAEGPAEEDADDEDESETATKTTVPEKKEEEEVIPDFSNYKEKLQWELEKIKKASCKNPASPTMNELNFLATFMFYISCVNQTVAADPSFAVKVLDKRLNLDLLNKFLMARALGLLAPTDDGNVALKEDIEAEKDKKKGKKPAAKQDMSRFTVNIGDFMDKSCGVSRGLGLHVSDADMVGWVYDFYDHEGDLMYKKIKAKKAKAEKDAAERKAKADKAAAERKKKAEKGKATIQTTVTPSVTAPAPIPEKTEIKTEAVASSESTDKPLTPSEIYGMDKPYEVMGNGYAQLNFMSMLS